MVALHEPSEELKERTARALDDNPGRSLMPVQAEGASRRGGEAPGNTFVEEVELRLRAIRTIRELEGRRAAHGNLVRKLSRKLMETPGESVHYRTLLDNLRETHSKWLAFEEQVWEANYIIRSTQWLVEMLEDPTDSD